MVANLSRLLVVLAPLPAPDLFVIDRYLAAAESNGIAGLLVVNKCDLGINDELRAELDAYTEAGYRWLGCSVRSGEGIDSVQEVCVGGVAALVGQSGVGKSSLAGHLIPDAGVEIGSLVREEEGRHTTTASRLFNLPRGGALIDSPGVRDFAPAVDRLDGRSLGFVEVERLAPRCRFSDCRHMREPNCAVRDASETGGMSPRRYESYRRLRRLYEELSAARGPERRRETSGYRLTTCQRVGQGSAVHVLELAADRHAVRDTAGADAPPRGELTQKMGCRLPFYCWVGGENHLAHQAFVQDRFQITHT